MDQKRSDHRLGRAERLRGVRVVSELFARGESHFAYPIRYVVMECKDVEHQGSGSPLEVLFNVPKRFHRRANKRNLLRRRVKEAYRLERNALRVDQMAHPLRIAMIYSTKEVLEYSAVKRSMLKIIDHLNTLYAPIE